MYALTWESGHDVWRERWYAFISLQTNLYMIWEDQVFVTDVVVIDSTREMMASSVISRLTSAVAELSTIVKIYKYKGLQEGHHFILMAMEVHPGMISLQWKVSLYGKWFH